ncbi:hypothetical protein [Aurantiacibacter flavus]|uniref:Uncharacterized protein n=1 Tax=Aurantiacibacter flavus TaxID=3145232 RepID=A0ABV0CTC2_9SPHN
MLEVIGDLAKRAKRGTPESMVAALAAKTSSLGSLPNVLHTELIDQEILGNPVEMRGVPIVGGAQTVTTSTGEKGVFFDESPEEKALRRWQEGAFDEDEHAHASVYRKNAKSIDLQAFIRATKAVRPKGEMLASSLSELLGVVDLFLDDPGSQYRTLSTALDMFDQPESSKRHVKKHWAAYGRPPIRYFLPYTYHCMRVFKLFGLGVGLGLISQRPTNVIDLQYLYYLPFCMVFTSADNLHHDLAPLFLKDEQWYVKSDDMQAALRELVAYYADHRAELKATGMMGFGRYPPLSQETVIHQIYDDLMPRWRKDALVPKKKISAEESDRIMKELRPIMEAIGKRASKGD